jgi:hypothetical protein
MPIPTPRPSEKKDDYLSRCMDDETMKKEYPNNDQRYAICNVKYVEGKMEEIRTALHSNKDNVKSI